jgi:hypothetical protein
MNLLKKLFPLAIILVLSYWSIKPLFQNGFYPMHDDTQVTRVYEMHKSLSDGMFPVRWVQDLGYGYGYPIFNFYAPLAYYIGAAFMFFGMDALLATKTIIGLGMLLAGIAMYFFAKEFWGKTGAVISALLYIYAPYHALNAYVRGAISELFAYAFVPLVFLGIYKVYANLENPNEQDHKKKKKDDTYFAFMNYSWWWVSITGLSYAAIILSHNLTAMMVTPFLFIFAFYLYLKLRMSAQPNRPYYIIVGLLLGMLLSAFYWLPVPFEMKYTDVLSVVGGGSDYADHFACLSQLWNSPWGYAGSAPGCTDGFSLKLGKLHILLGLLALPGIFLVSKKNKTHFKIILLFLLFLLISLFLTVGQSKFIWDSIPHMAFFQFPWRFILLVTFLISFIGGGICWFIENKAHGKKKYKYLSVSLCGVVAIGIIYVNAEIFVPSKIIPVTVKDYTDREVINWKISKISDEYMPKGFFKPLRNIDVPKRRIEGDKTLEVLSIDENTQKINARLYAKEKTTAYVNIAYFPGWHVYINGEQTWFKYSGVGLHIDIPKGQHDVVVRFTQTPVEKAGNIVSLAGVIILLAGIIRFAKNNSYG